VNIYWILVTLQLVPTNIMEHYSKRYNRRNWIKAPSRYFPHQSAHEKGRRLAQKEKFNA